MRSPPGGSTISGGRAEPRGEEETQVSDRFWVLGLLGAMLGIALALL